MLMCFILWYIFLMLKHQTRNSLLVSFTNMKNKMKGTPNSSMIPESRNEK